MRSRRSSRRKIGAWRQQPRDNANRQRRLGQFEPLERRDLLSLGSPVAQALVASAARNVIAPLGAAQYGSMSTAMNLGTLSGTKSVTGTVSSTDRDDYYVFTVAQGNFGLSLTGLQADADVRFIQDINGNLRADYGETLAMSQNWGTASESISGTLAAGTYYVDVYRYSGSTPYVLTLNAAVSKTPPTITIAAAQLDSASRSVSLLAAATDAPGQSLTYAWTATAYPAGAIPTITNSAAGSASVALGAAGSYTFTVMVTDTAGAQATRSVSLTVAPVLHGLSVTPSTTTVAIGTPQTFTVAGVDQFGKSMTAPSDCAWSTTFGSIVATTGVFTSSTAGSGTVTVKSNSTGYSASAGVTVVKSNFLGMKDAGLASLTQSLDTDGSINRSDMIQILTAAGSDDGIVDANELGDLRTILNNASTLKIPDYVRVLAGDVVNGNTANAHYQGATLGNLAAGSSSTVLNKLVNKWFKGTDHPTSSYAYQQVSGSLFAVTPSHLDEYQGALGDCYLISSLGSIADSVPAAVENMFVNNGDGTYTVRFYASNGVADYVTVDAMLPVYGSGLAYADKSAAGSLWIPLAEKAYAQWNETGKEGRDGTNSYAAIEGGWMADVDKQVLNKTAAEYNVYSSSDQTALVNAVNTRKAVTIGTITSNNYDDSLPYGLFGSHAYAVVGYNGTQGYFQLYNPWGSNQPSYLTWSQLVATCDGFVVADASGTTAIVTSVLRPSLTASTATASATTVATTEDSSDATPIAAPVAVADNSSHAVVSSTTRSDVSSGSLMGILGTDRRIADRMPGELTARAVDELFAHGLPGGLS